MIESVARLRQLMDEDNLRQIDIVEKTGYKKGTVSAYVKEDGPGPSWKFLKELEKKLKWSANWVESGVGPKRIIKLMPPRPLEQLLAQETKISYRPASPIKPSTSDADTARLVGIHDVDLFQEVKFVNYKAWATFTDNYSDFDFYDVTRPTYPVYLPRLPFAINPDKHLVFEILGDSMEERLYERDVILTELQDDGDIEYLNSGMYVVAYRNQLVIKRVKTNDLMDNGTLTLHSDNAKHGQITIRRADIRYMWRFIAVVFSSHQ